MHSFHLEFSSYRRRRPGANLLLACAGALALVACVYYDVSQLQPREQALAERSRSIDAARRQSAVQAADRAVVQLSAPDASQVLDELNRPWGALFAVLGHAAKSHKIAFASIAPEVESGHVTVVGDAESFAQLTGFYKALLTDRHFRSVELESHNHDDAKGEALTHFKLLLTWNK
jgi:hypothetical protein